MTALEQQKERHCQQLLALLPTTMRLYSIRQVAQALQVDPAVVRRLVRSGRIEGRRVGGQIRVSQAALEKYVLQDAVKAGP